MSEKPVPLLWLDLETTGLNDDDQILEVAACITTPTAPFDRLDTERFHALVVPESPYLVGDTVVAMHARNGLWNQIASLEDPKPRIRDAERDLLAFIGRTCHGSKVTLAGSGVARFDYGMLQRYMPRVANRLTYFTFDTGVIRRWSRACGLPSEHTEMSTHRAWDDVMRALEQTRQLASRSSTPGHYVCATCFAAIDGPMVATEGQRVVHYPECPA